MADWGVFSSAAHVRKLLERGNGIYWFLGNQKLWLRSPQRIAQELGAGRANSHRHTIKIERLRTRAMRRGALFAATLPVGTPIRQLALRQRTGVSERTQRRYRRANHFSVKRQDAALGTAFASTASPDQRRALAYLERAHGVYVSGPDARVMKRIPNAHFPLGERIRRGRRSRTMFATQPLQALADGDRAVLRTFFDGPTQWMRCRSLKLGTEKAVSRAYPYNLAYLRAGPNTWKAVAE
jgi:hypothetical protein